MLHNRLRAGLFWFFMSANGSTTRTWDRQSISVISVGLRFSQGLNFRQNGVARCRGSPSCPFLKLHRRIGWWLHHRWNPCRSPAAHIRKTGSTLMTTVPKWQPFRAPPYRANTACADKRALFRQSAHDCFGRSPVDCAVRKHSC
jgi:hypothetical protein